MGVASDFENITDKVENLLKEFPATRNDDKLLWLLYLRKFCGLNNESWEILHNIMADCNTPAMESIRRIRQKFQEKGIYVGEKRQKRLKEAVAVRKSLREF